MGNTIGLTSEKLKEFKDSANGTADAMGQAYIKAEQMNQEMPKIKEMQNPFQGISSGIMGLAQGLMSVTQLLSAFKSLGSIWNDEDATTGEKLYLQ